MWMKIIKIEKQEYNDGLEVKFWAHNLKNEKILKIVVKNQPTNAYFFFNTENY